MKPRKSGLSKSLGWKRLPSSGVRTLMGGTLIALSLVRGAGAQVGDCRPCHADVHVPSPAHRDLDCTDCHSNVTRLPHPPQLLKSLGGDALCRQCHEDVVLQVATSVHGPESCGDCHGSAHEIPPPQWGVCGECHAGATEAFQASAHRKSLSCSSCHEGPHAIRPVKEPGSRVHPFQEIQTCGTCHAKPPQLIDGYLQSVHGRGLLLGGLAVAPSCSDCHGSHGVFPIRDVRSTVSARNVPTTCGRCHVGIFSVWSKESVHGRLWREGRTGGPVCTTCHGSHRIQEPWAGIQRLKFPETCGGCHGERYHTYRDGFHGRATGLGFLTAAICSDCHTPHQNEPARDPKSSVHPANLVRTCGRCHGPVPASFVTYDPHAEPRDPRQNRPLYYVWLFMTGLLVFVFGFFGIHTLLWLQRSVVGAVRGEFHSIRRWRDEAVWVRRFAPVHMWTHVAIVVSFLLLALTGLPLKYHSSWWGQVLASVWGGIERTRLFHRIGAGITFGYAVFHLGYILYWAGFRGDRGILWGWRSMMPRWQDFVDLWRNVRYFLYLGPRPRLDRWTYWEKFDYFAVFWGVVIIGLSGLFLWFPKFWTRFLPGWVLNAAFLVHSDEALLAVGFIFIFHFFHNHLRPENFPMDPVMFIGILPLKRFQEERPAEYQRLVERGELEKYLEGPPSKCQVRLAYVFGFLTLTVGVLLIVLIMGTALGIV